MHGIMKKKKRQKNSSGQSRSLLCSRKLSAQVYRRIARFELPFSLAPMANDQRVDARAKETDWQGSNDELCKINRSTFMFTMTQTRFGEHI
jgi:hypothetical protein